MDMNDTDNTAASDVSRGPTSGQLLREARQARDLSIQEAAVKLHLHQRIIEALEKDDQSQLPTPIYVRGYLRNYARLLGLDPQTILSAYDDNDNQHPELRPPLKAPNQVSSSDKPVKAVTYLLTLGLVVLLLAWWQSRHLNEDNLIDLDAWQGSQSFSDKSDADIADEQTETIDNTLGYPIKVIRHPDSPTYPRPINEPANQPPAAVDTNRSPVDSSDQTDSDLPSVVASPDSGSEPIETLPEADEQIVSSSNHRDNATDDLLRLDIKDESWVEIYDAQGKRLYVGLAKSDETIEVNGTPPLRVLLGYAPGVSVTYDGRNIDTIEHSRAGVAQFRVGE